MSAERNARTLRRVLLVAAAMLALSFASVPLYRAVCQVTGWGGTTMTLKANPHKGETPAARRFTVRFNADTDRNLPWAFRPDSKPVTLAAGQDGFASFTARNESTAPVTGTAVYNVTPLRAGKYFYKTQCFCFSEQVLKPGQTVHMPVTFFIDPKILNDRELRDLETITLSYTFYQAETKALDSALEKFMAAKDNPPK
jgi:cytochrome c oxidase assembly protein subunit 11